MVTGDVAEAVELVRRGIDVVLIVGADTALPSIEGSTGRLAVMVGDPSDPPTQAAAREMDEELFSSRR